MNNIVLISIDDLRYDCIGRYFDRRRFSRYDLRHEADTPVIDRLAAEAASFGQCIAPSSFTPPSHASMLTGLYPRRHGVHTFYDMLPGNVPTLTEILKEHGFRTWARIENSSLRLLDLTRGMEFVDDHADEGKELFDHLLSREPFAGERNFVFIHLFDCHSPYGFIKGKGNQRHVHRYVDHVKEICTRRGIDFDRIDGQSQREARFICRDHASQSEYIQTLTRMRGLDFALKAELRNRGVFYDEMVSSYLRGVSLFDRIKFRAVLDSLESCGLGDDSLLIVTSDHGEARHIDLDGDIYFSNGFDLHEGHIRVPLIVRGPGITQPREISQPVSLTDLPPTVLDLAGIAYDPTRFDGVSLGPLLTAEAPEDDHRAVYGECWAYRGGFNQFGQIGWQRKGFRRKRMVRTGRFKLVRLGNDLTVESLAILPIRDAIERLYNDVLGRFPSICEVVVWKWLLEKGSISVEEMFDLFTEKIARTIGKYALIDPAHDCEDENNLFEDDAYRAVRGPLLRLLDRYDQRDGDDRAGHHLTARQEEKVKEHLRALGYL